MAKKTTKKTVKAGKNAAAATKKTHGLEARATVGRPSAVVDTWVV